MRQQSSAFKKENTHEKLSWVSFCSAIADGSRQKERRPGESTVGLQRRAASSQHSRRLSPVGGAACLLGKAAQHEEKPTGSQGTYPGKPSPLALQRSCPILLPSSSVNQRLPSGPAMMPPGELEGLLGPAGPKRNSRMVPIIFRIGVGVGLGLCDGPAVDDAPHPTSRPTTARSSTSTGKLRDARRRVRRDLSTTKAPLAGQNSSTTIE